MPFITTLPSTLISQVHVSGVQADKVLAHAALPTVNVKARISASVYAPSRRLNFLIDLSPLLISSFLLREQGQFSNIMTDMDARSAPCRQKALKVNRLVSMQDLAQVFIV
jgi:hypothetical protein